MTMSDEDALLCAICENPDEDTPRLVFADFLQENGGKVGTAWAHFIRAQIELARLPGDTANETLAARVRLFDVPYWHAQWFGRLGLALQFLSWRDWERGFPVRLTVNAEMRHLFWERLARVPFGSLTVRWATDDAVGELVTHPELARVRELQLESTGFYNSDPLGERTFLALAACPHLTGLRSLDAHSAVLTDHCAEVLISAPHLANLGSFFVRRSYWHQHWLTVSDEVRERLNERFSTFRLN
jgi:uncharacterized protein (TIGR02996 family)